MKLDLHRLTGRRNLDITDPSIIFSDQTPALHPPHLIHLANQRIDLLLPIPQIAALDEMLKLPRPKASRRIAQLERPQKVARLLEIRPHGENLMDQILHAHDAVLAQMVFNDLVVGEGDSLLVDFAVAALVDEFADGFEGRVAICDVGLDDFEHFAGGFCEADEDAVVDLEKAEELQRFARFGSHLGDTGGL